MGKNVINLAIGQPDFLPLDEVLEATANFVMDGKVQYTESKGIFDLRKSIVDYYQVDASPETEVVVTAGGKLGIFGAVWSVCNPGDNVIVLDPSWVSYGSIIKSFGCIPKYLEVGKDFTFDEDDLRNLIDDRTKALIVNSPCNPTGQIISEKKLASLYNLCAENEILLISDEIYNEYVFGNKPFFSLTKINNWKDYGVAINGFSKTFSMTGFRVGYAISNELITNEINKVMQLTASCATNFAQHAAVVALKNIGKMRVRIQEIMKPRLDRLIELDGELLGFDLLRPQGAMYGWFKLHDVQDTAKWAKELLKEKLVAVTPGIGFGPHGEGWFRISYATKLENLEDGLQRISDFVNKKN